MGVRSLIKHRILPYWKSIFVIALPIVFSPLLFLSKGQEGKAGYVIVVVALYWMTEALPLAASSLLPILLLPLLGVMDSSKVCKAYINETSVMFLGSLIVALSVEYCNLHKRIALKVLLTVGASPKWIILGFMLTSMFLSMWISNTASTAMMVPIANAIIRELYKEKVQQKKETTSLPASKSTQSLGSISSISIETISASSESSNAISALESQPSEIDTEESKMRKCILLSVAYASNVGGTATLIGTPPNLVLKGVISDLYSKAPELNFATWMAFNVPVVLINIFLCWVWLQVLFIGFRRKDKGVSQVKSLLRKQYKELNGITFHEFAVALLFVTCVALWFFREPQFIPGWASIFRPVKVSDASAVVLIVFFLFTVPAVPKFWCFNDSESCGREEPSCALLDWNYVQAKLPWGIILLLGGGFAISEASKVSGLSLWIGTQLSSLQVLPPFAIMLIICIMAAAITEVASNTATTNILLPILAEMANAMKMNPLYLMIPATISCSYAFMLPVATAPNAIVFSASKMKSRDMIKAGLLMNVICVTVLCGCMAAFGTHLFGSDTFPDWASMDKVSALPANATGT